MGDGVAKVVNRLRDAKETGKLGKRCVFLFRNSDTMDNVPNECVKF